MTASLQERLDAYLEAFETLSPEGLDVFDGLCAEDVRFVDPFNDVHGIDAFKAVFSHMYVTLAEPRFEVTDRACSARAGYARWRFDFRMRGQPMSIEGMSEIAFDDRGRVIAHIDHWDAGVAVYSRLPVIGPMVRWVRRRLSAG